MINRNGGSEVDHRGQLAFAQFRDLALAELGYSPTDIGLGACLAVAKRLGVSASSFSRYQRRCSLARCCDMLDAWEKAGGEPMALHYVGGQVEVEVVGRKSKARRAS